MYIYNIIKSPLNIKLKTSYNHHKNFIKKKNEGAGPRNVSCSFFFNKVFMIIYIYIYIYIYIHELRHNTVDI